MREEPISADEAEPIINILSSLIFKAQDAHYDIATPMKSHIQALEERANTASVQKAESISINLHCLVIKLTTDWVKNQPLQDVADENRKSLRLVDNNVYHFCLFSDNLLAVSAAMNSTVSNADHPQQFTFHVVVGGINYGATQAWWFLSNDFKGSTIQVQKVEDFTWLNASYSPVVEDMSIEPKPRSPKYVSLLSHLCFYVPEIYHIPTLDFFEVAMKRNV